MVCAYIIYVYVSATLEFARPHVCHKLSEVQCWRVFGLPDDEIDRRGGHVIE